MAGASALSENPPIGATPTPSGPAGLKTYFIGFVRGFERSRRRLPPVLRDALRAVPTPALLLASTILSPEFQTIFNQTKGSIPARLDVDLSNGFNPCQQLSQKDLQASIDGGTLVRSMAHNMTIPQKVRGAIMDTVTEFVATPDMTAQDAASAMADAAEAQM